MRDGTVVVHDHGPGIAEADLPHIFDRFYRSSAARGLPGSGLGLAIVAQVVAAEGGTIVAENDPAGGARMTMRLPSVDGPDEHDQTGNARPGLISSRVLMSAKPPPRSGAQTRPRVVLGGPESPSRHRDAGGDGPPRPCRRLPLRPGPSAFRR